MRTYIYLQFDNMYGQNQLRIKMTNTMHIFFFRPNNLLLLSFLLLLFNSILVFDPAIAVTSYIFVGLGRLLDPASASVRMMMSQTGWVLQRWRRMQK